MEKKVNNKLYERIIDKQLMVNYELNEALHYTKAFKKFCKENQNSIRAKLEEHGIATDDPEEELKIELEDAFLDTMEGKKVLDKLLENELIEPMAVGYSRKLLDRRYLSLHIDLSYSKKRIMIELNHIIATIQAQMDRLLDSPRGKAILKPDEIQRSYKAYDLVEEYLAKGDNYHQSLTKATIALFSKVRAIRLKNPPAEDRRYQETRRWYRRAKAIIKDL
jgi:hypothetical protein